MNSNLTPAPDTGAEPALIQRLTDWAMTGLNEELERIFVPQGATGSASVREVLATPEIVARQSTNDASRLTVRFRIAADFDASASFGQIAADDEMSDFFGEIGDDGGPDDSISTSFRMRIALDVPIVHRPGTRAPEDLALAGSPEILAEPGSDVSPA